MLRFARNDDRVWGQIGRSMIEMLGVLAIIAILSVWVLNDDLKLCGSSLPAEFAQHNNCKYYRDGLLPQIAQKCAICSQYSCDLKLIISNGN